MITGFNLQLSTGHRHLCRGLGVKRGVENFKMLIEIVAGLAAAIALLFALIRAFSWVRDGFK